MDTDQRAAGTPTRGDYTPPGYSGRIEALMDLIRFGPDAFDTAAFHVCLYMADRTIPYGKRSDRTSRSQMVKGIYARKTGLWIRGGCGLSESGVKKGIRSLLDCGVLKKQLGREENGAHSPAKYNIDWVKLKARLDKIRTRAEGVGRVGHQETTLGPQETKGRARSNQALGHVVTNPLGTTCPYRVDKSEIIITEKKEQSICPPDSSTEASVCPSVSWPEKTKNDFSLRVDDDEPPKTEDEAKKRVSDLISVRKENDARHILAKISRKFEAAGWNSFWIEYWRCVRTVTVPTKAGGGHYVSVAQDLIAEKKAELLERLLPTPTAVTETREVDLCENCKCERGKGAVIASDRILPCPDCATPEWAAQLEEMERRRLQRKAQIQAQRAELGGLQDASELVEAVSLKGGSC